MTVIRILLTAVLLGSSAISHAAVNADEVVQACTAGDTSKVQGLVSAGANVNRPDSSGRLPLLSALFSRNAELVSLLLRKGADPNTIGRCPERDCPGHPSLIFAGYLNEPKLVRLLLDAKADLAWDDHRATRLANAQRRVEAFKILREAGGHEWPSAGADVSPSPNPTSAKSRAVLGTSELLSAAAPSSKPGQGKLRLAIVADADTQAVSDLLASSLGEQFQLVERNELNRVLQERQLSRDFGADGSKAQQLGALLGADAIAVLRKVDIRSESSLELRLIRVSPGILLGTSFHPWPLKNSATWAAAAAEHLVELSAKVRSAHAIAVSPADFRPTMNTPAAEALARQAALLLTERMANRPEVVVLERTALTELARERTLSPQGEFWTGSYLMDGTAEAALDSKGQAGLTLRLQPMDGRDPLILTSRGNVADVRTLVDDLATRATKALSLQPAPPSDSAKGAERYFAESQAASQRSMYLTAYRAAETAALLGLQTPEFAQWRLKAALGAILWQGKSLAESYELEAVKWAGWSERWIDQRVNGAEWLRVSEWLQLGSEVSALWREQLLQAIDSGDAEKVAAAVASGKEVVASCFAVYGAADTSANLIDRPEQLEGVLAGLKQTFTEALAALAEKPALAQAQADLTAQFARAAGALYPNRDALTKTFAELLGRHFAADDLPTRAVIRQSILIARPQTRMALYDTFSPARNTAFGATVPSPAAESTWPDLVKVLDRSREPDDLITAETLRFRLSSSQEQRKALAEHIFTLLQDHRQMFVREPRALDLWSAVEDTMVSKGASKFVGQRTATGQVPNTPELLMLRRQLFVEIAENSPFPGPALRLHDSEYHPSGEDEAKMAALLSKVLADMSSSMRAAGTARSPAATAAPLKPKLLSTPSYADCPPLKVPRVWTADMAPGVPFFASYMGATGAMEGDRLWLLAEDHESRDSPLTHDWLVTISAPSLKTESWALPPEAGSAHSDKYVGLQSSILLDKDRVFLAKAHSYFAVGDRRTRAWKVNTNLQPLGAMIKLGEDLYFLTESGGARGLVRYSLETDAAELLASNRRVPAQSPLDDPDLEAASLQLNPDGLLDILVKERIAATDRINKKVQYDPASRTWRPLTTFPPPPRYNFIPLKTPGLPIAYTKREPFVWTLQTSLEDMPKVRVALDFAPPEGTKNPERRSLRWYWSPQGYFAMEGMFETTIWFIPQSEFETYLRTHEPKEDETSVAPPLPGRPTR